MNLHKKLYDLLQYMQMKPETLSKALGLKETAIQYILNDEAIYNGTKELDTKTLIALAKYGISINWLLDDNYEGEAFINNSPAQERKALTDTERLHSLGKLQAKTVRKQGKTIEKQELFIQNLLEQIKDLKSHPHLPTDGNPSAETIHKKLNVNDLTFEEVMDALEEIGEESRINGLTHEEERDTSSIENYPFGNIIPSNKKNNK
ncbi:MAG: hypothetical protein ACRBFS_19970 [Aureispira sp.]